MITNITNTMNGVTPFYDHQQPTASALITWGDFLFDMGTKLRGKASESQIMRFKTLSDAYVVIRQTLAQNFIHELKITKLEYLATKQQNRIKELEAEVEKLTKTINFE